jgi:hypothetical protein
MAATVVVLMTACGGKPFDYRPTHEIPEGPGLLTKERDGATLYDSKGKGFLQSLGKKKTGETEKNIINKDDFVAPDHPDFKEFEEYLQWKEWRKKSKNSAEYQEFIEWKKWKSYQEWKQQQPKSK